MASTQIRRHLRRQQLLTGNVSLAHREGCGLAGLGALVIANGISQFQSVGRIASQRQIQDPAVEPVTMPGRSNGTTDAAVEAADGGLAAVRLSLSLRRSRYNNHAASGYRYLFPEVLRHGYKSLITNWDSSLSAILRLADWKEVPLAMAMEKQG